MSIPDEAKWRKEYIHSKNICYRLKQEINYRSMSDEKKGLEEDSKSVSEKCVSDQTNGLPTPNKRSSNEGILIPSNPGVPFVHSADPEPTLPQAENNSGFINYIISCFCCCDP